MDNEKGTESAGTDKSDNSPMTDMADDSPHLLIEPEEFEERARVELHKRGRREAREQHVDLSKEEYTPDEVAHMVGTSRDTVIHAVRRGELKAERAGQTVV